jgi:hypothetical protein
MGLGSYQTDTYPTQWPLRVLLIQSTVKLYRLSHSSHPGSAHQAGCTGRDGLPRLRQGWVETASIQSHEPASYC